MSGWLDRLTARPIAAGERRRAFVIAAAVLMIAAAALSFARHQPYTSHRVVSGAPAAIQPAPAAPPMPSAPSQTAPPAIPTPDGGQLAGTAPAAAMAAGRRFLLAYLRFSYGQVPPRFPDASQRLGAQLRRFHVDAGPALRARRLSLLALRARPRDGGFEIGALASDGTSTFPIAAIVRRVGGRLRAVRVVTAAASP